jgi:thymidylate synthase (FAD)
MGSDLSVVRSARVSYDAEWRSGEDAGKDAKLINYLVKNKHTSPLESVVFTFEVKAPIFVFRQWHRHRTWSFNEVSARYSELPAEFYVPEVNQITMQSTSNKQMRTATQHPLASGYRQLIEASCQKSFENYHHMLANGVPRELARGVLPVNTYSHMFATVDLHNLAHFLRLRLHEHSQYEIRVYAQAMLELIEPVVPICVQAIKEHLWK